MSEDFNSKMLERMVMSRLQPPPGYAYMLTIQSEDGETVLRFPIRSNQAVIGRAEDCDIFVPFSVLSAHHCAIIFYDGRFLVKDLGSSNGTFTNPDKALANFNEIRPGETFLMANLPVTFELAPQKLLQDTTISDEIPPPPKKALPKLDGPLSASSMDPPQKSKKGRHRTLFGR